MELREGWVAALEAENAALRRTLSDVGRIMAAPKREGWNASTKLVYVALQLQALAAPQDGAYSLLELSGSALAGSLGLSAATANNAMNRLAAAGLLERYLNRGLYDEAGREVDPRACHPGRADLHFESHSWQAMRAVPEALPALPTSAYSERARARAAGQRADYADLKARLTRLACPHCGAVGEWHLTCAACQQSPEPPSPPDEEPPPNQAPTPDDPPQPQPIEVQPPPEEALRGGDELQPLVIQGAEVQMPRPAPWTSAEVWQWLLRRIGASRAMIRQRNEPKRKYEPYSGRVDPGAYLAGAVDHVYGSRPALGRGRSWLLSFDVDHQPLRVMLELARRLAGAGWPCVVWERGHGGKIELYFDAPVLALAAFEVALGAAPGLAAISTEAFPVNPGLPWEKRVNCGYSWPLFRLEGARSSGGQVVACPMYAFAGEQEWHSPGWRDDAATICAALPQVVIAAGRIPADSGERPGAATGLPPLSASVGERAGGRQTLVEAAIDWWNASHSEADVFTGYERWQAGYVAIREERTPSARRDRDGYFKVTFTDFGTGEKLDLFEIYCRVRGLDKREEIWRVVDEYLAAHGRAPRR